MKPKWHHMIPILILVLLAACSSSDSPPQIKLEVNGQPESGLAGPYCWGSGIGSALCVDPIPPSLEQMTLHPLDGTVRLQLEKPLPDSFFVSLSPDIFEQPVDSTQLDADSFVEWTPNVPPGNYLLTVSGKWNQGDAGYWFYVSLP